jgi:glycosyltransferase involved in cell wall biosynthesis
MQFKKNKKNIDIVIPFYNEFKNLKILIPQIIKSTSNFKKFKIRYIFINDGSTDGSEKIVQNYLKFEKFNLIINKEKLGQTLSYKKYLELFKSDFFIRIDADNQDNPVYLKKILKLLMDNDYDMILADRLLRKHPISMIILTYIYNLITKFLIKVDLPTYSSSLVSYKRNLIKPYNLKYNDHRYMPLIAIFNGAKKIHIFSAIHKKRRYGQSNYSIIKKIIFGFPEFFYFFIRLKIGKFRRG